MKLFCNMLVLTLLVLQCALAHHEFYKGWKAYTVYPETKEHQQKLLELSSILEMDFLKHAVVGKDGVTLVKPEFQQAFEDALTENGIGFKVFAEDVMESLNQEDQLNAEHKLKQKSRNGGKVLPYDVYSTLYEIYDYLHEIAESYPDLVTLVDAGRSFYGEPIYYLKISSTNFQVETKPVIFVDGGIHAREWVAPAAATYAIHKLVENITQSELIDNADWIIHPVVNPDGYEYTFSTFRFWRKTLSTVPNSVISSVCPGVDGNRNYNISWNTVGVGITPCADNYAGPSPFSEVETQVVRDIMLEYVGRMPLYISIHSYGSMILYPWGDSGELPDNAVEVHKVGTAMGRAIHAASDSIFEPWSVGNSILVVGYPASGGSMDYAHDIGVPLSYTYELPGLSGGYAGFNPDPEHLQNIVEQTWAGIAEGARLAITRFRK